MVCCDLYQLCSKFAHKIYSVVDRILRQQQADREAADKVTREKADQTALPRPAPEPTPLISPAQQTAAPFPEKGETFFEDETGSLPGGLPSPLETQPRPNSVLQSFKRKFANKNRSQSPPPSTSHSSGMAPDVSPHVTPLSNICGQFGIQCWLPSTDHLYSC
jgi:hypothetical protein